MKAAFERFLARHGAPGRLGVAVSGGGDSMALLALAAAQPGLVAEAVTLDHGLRPEAAQEAAKVAELCARLGVSHTTLTWRAGPGRGNLQAAARKARYGLIARWAQGRGLGVLALGHTLDDQAETVLMRLVRGSGVDGLSAMDEVIRREGLLWLRPLLHVPRAALRTYLRAEGLEWCEDPSNSDMQFQRVRARAALVALEPLGITAEGLAATAQRQRRARQALEAQVAQALDAHARDENGTVMVDRAALSLLPEIRDRFFAFLLQRLTGADYRPRLSMLHRWIASAGTGGGTLTGCLLCPGRGGLRLAREYAAVAGLRVSVTEPWDRRWRAVPAALPCAGRLELAPLGEAGLRQLSAQARQGLHPHWRETGLPEVALKAQPGVWEGAALRAAPGAFWPNGWRLEVAPAACWHNEGALSH